MTLKNTKKKENNIQNGIQEYNQLVLAGQTMEIQALPEGHMDLTPMITMIEVNIVTVIIINQLMG